jgi:catechol 2,3-dioxygenase-like lactoylglutathione lyase family enzyme
LLQAPSTALRSVFLGDAAHPASGLVELVDLGPVPDPVDPPAGPPAAGPHLLSIMTDVDSALDRLADLGLGGSPRRVEVSGVAMAVVVDPDGVLVELIAASAAGNLEQMASPPADRA